MGIDIGLDKITSKDFWRAVAAECFGTMLFLLCVTCVALQWRIEDPNAGYNKNMTEYIPVDVSANNVEIGIGIGLAIASLTHIFGHVSGGHLNPAVTLGMIIGSKISIVKGLFYMVAQFLGGIIGSSITYALTPAPRRAFVTLGVTSTHHELEDWQGLVLECMFTFILVIFVFAITDEKKKVESYATNLGIGIVIWVCHVCLIPMTGCGINPARSFGPAVVMNHWEDHWIYWLGPFFGGILAALMYKYIFYVEGKSVKSYSPNDDSTPMTAVNVPNIE